MSVAERNRNALMARRIHEDGMSLGEVAREFGVTRQRVAQIVGPLGGLPRERNARRRQRQQLEELRQRLLRGIRCRFCGCWVARAGRDVRTCSQQCAEDYARVARYLNQHRYRTHRLASARKARGDYSADYLKRVIEGAPPNRRYIASLEVKASLRRFLSYPGATLPEWVGKHLFEE